MIISGREAGTYRDAERLHKSFKRHHGAQPKASKDRNLFFLTADTSLEGTQLLTARGLNVAQYIEKFVQWRLVDKAESVPWTNRQNPLDN
jgi:hypothetical protein